MARLSHRHLGDGRHGGDRHRGARGSILWSLLRALFRSPQLFAARDARAPAAQGLRCDLARADRDRRRRCARRAAPAGTVEKPAGRAARAAVARADRATQRRPGRRRGSVSRHGRPRRYAAARSARPVRRGAAPQRCGRRTAVCRAGRQGRACARLGGPGGARIPLPGGRLGRRDRDAGEPPQQRNGEPRRRRRLRAVLLTARALDWRTRSATWRARSPSRR